MAKVAADIEDYKLAYPLIEKRAAEYLAKAAAPTIPAFLQYLRERREKPRR